MKCAILYIPCPNEKKAKEIALHLIAKKLIACANIHPCKSIYYWKGRLCNEKEYVIIAKTTEKNWPKAAKEAEKIHPYEIPCIAQYSAQINNKYASWLKKQVQ